MADSRIDTNSSATTPNTYAEQQLAIQDAQMARERAALAAGNAAFKAAASRPGGEQDIATTNKGINVTYNAAGAPSLPTPNAKLSKKGK